jgi:hypothetical protein
VTRKITLAQQRTALAALTYMSGAFGHLPGAHFALSTIYPDQVDISLHDGASDFEVWREALGIPTDAVQLKGREAPHLKATAAFAGATVELIAYTVDIPAGDAA